MNLFQRFLELVPGADPLLVGTVTAVGTTTTTLSALAGGTVTVRGTGIAIGKKAFTGEESWQERRRIYQPMR